jgi:signal transduction histidine kinase
VKKAIRIKIEMLPRDMIRLSIADSGPGISAESMAKIFEVFYSTRKGGSGFGLAIARKIVEEHQGKLWAENNTESRGATFTMELPTLAPQDRAVKPSPATGIARFWGRANANEG